MRWDILMGIVIYVIAISVIIGIIVLKKGKGWTGDSYLYGDKKIGPLLSGVTLGVASIGALNITGFMENATTLGIVTLWFVVAVGMQYAVLATFFASIYRKLGFNTIAEILYNLFDKKTRVIASLIGLVICFGILSLETIGGAIMLSTITSIDLRMCLFLFMICALVYLLISGMWQIAYLNIINTVIMYVSLIIAFIFVTVKLPAGWSGVDAFFAGQGLTHALSFWPSDVNLLLGFAFAFVIAIIFTDTTDQGKMQYVLTAADPDTARKASFIAMLVNTPCGFFTVAFGMAAWSISEFASYGPKLSGPVMLLTYLPTVLVVILFAAIIVIVLSTWARFSMGLSQIVINDFYLAFSKASDKGRLIPLYSRLLIVIGGLAALIPAYFLPHLLMAGLFLLSLGIPLFTMMVIGLFWKRNSTAAFLTMLISIIVSFIWEYSNIAILIGMPGWFGTTYILLVIAVIFGVGLTAILPGEKGLLTIKSSDTEPVNL